MSLHADFSPSSADRWIRCTKSVVLEKEVLETVGFYAKIDSLTQDAAKTGSLIHDAAYKRLSTGVHVDNIDQNTLDIVNQYEAYIKSLILEAHDVEVYYEHKVYFSEDCWGTADCIIVDYTAKTIHVIDLKTGKGVLVDAFQNPQLTLYGLGVLAQLNKEDGLIEWVQMHIFQPTRNNIKSWLVSVEDLLIESAKFKQAIYRAKSGGEYNPGKEQCMFCKASVICPALAQIFKNFVTMSKKESSELSADNIKFVLENRDLVIRYIKTIEDAAMAMLDANDNSIPGWRIGIGRSSWEFAENGEYELKAKYGNSICIERVLPFNELKKLISPTDFATYVKQNPGKLVLKRTNGSNNEVDE